MSTENYTRVDMSRKHFQVSYFDSAATDFFSLICDEHELL